MPDITMCSSTDCPRRNECYRAQAKPSERQSWATFEPENCQFFWPFRVPVENVEVISDSDYVISPGRKAYVYQPFPPQENGKSYGVGGLEIFGLTYEEADIRGITKSDAEEIVRVCNESPEFAASFVRGIKSTLGIQNVR